MAGLDPAASSGPRPEQRVFFPMTRVLETGTCPGPLAECEASGSQGVCVVLCWIMDGSPAHRSGSKFNGRRIFAYECGYVWVKTGLPALTTGKVFGSCRV